jgi:phosphatidylglycerophosphatase A
MSPVLLLATGLGFGYASVAPGTVGAIWGLPLAWAIYHVPAPGNWPTWPVHLGLIALFFAVGIPVCTAAALRLGKKDPSAVVYDEIATIPIVFLFLPPSALARPWVWVAGFVLHRVFDILKPPPIRQLERFSGGWGIMADDAAAAVFGCCVLHLMVWFVGRM